jgi:SNF2 family DNA or RNA helicase
MLRRTNRILEDYLPPKSEQVVFCRPSEAQVALYRFFLNTKNLRQVMTGAAGTSSSLECMSILTKLCNYPGLVRKKAMEYLEDNDAEDLLRRVGKDTTIDDFFPADMEEDEAICRAELSGKMSVLETLLLNVRKTTQDKVVVVSNFTKTLDVIQMLCAAKGWKTLRLDGSTAQTKRQGYVDTFNRPDSDVFVFLLSSKAGGTGLNLVGGNRLILFDSDWNPATDRQAMARVWRDGQVKRVYLYRLLMTGSIDEKIFQRQLSKEGLSSSVLDNAFGSVQFSKTDLKDIFSLNANTLCDTHDLICNRFFSFLFFSF